MPLVHIEDVLLEMVAQRGDRYIFGAEARASDPNPTAFDCSELVEWACARAGVTPKMPDGADNQRRHCEQAGTMIPVAQGLRSRGALLFVGDNTGTGRDRTTHVAGSLGDGTTIEARGSKWGVGTWPSVGRFDYAALIPGCDYSPGHATLPGPDLEEDDMPKVYRLDTDTSVAGEKFAAGYTVLAFGNVRRHLNPGADVDEVLRQWGPLVAINAVAFGHLVASTALDMTGMRSLPDPQRGQLAKAAGGK